MYVWYSTSEFSSMRRIFSSYTLLSSSWEKYKSIFITKDGNVVDASQGNITTSEGQSYALLRSVWMDDKQTFDTVWIWTRNTIKRPADNLFGWRWGKNSDGKYGFITGGGDNSATDADEDIALALIFAAHRWHDTAYLASAKLILSDIWSKETAVIVNKRYLLAGNWANRSTDVIINPSYFAPYAWRIFAEVDHQHNWDSLIVPAYENLSLVSTALLDKEASVGLPPDWISIDKGQGVVHETGVPNLTTNYGFDALRIPWRVGLDYQWNKEPRAKEYLRISCSFLSNVYKKNGKLAATYDHSGGVIYADESPSLYAALQGCLLVLDPSLAQKVYQDKIITLYSNEFNTFNDVLSYYDQNWLWFGAAMYNHALEKY